MTPEQFQYLLDLIQGRGPGRRPAFIIDSPWLPNWAGIRIIDYFTSENLWFEAHIKAARTFPDALFLPGFWSEFGMCTEPSAFGARCSFPENEFPHAHPVIADPSDIDRLTCPNPATDGLLPFMLQRLLHQRSRIEHAGYCIPFSVSRGPLNVASYLMGTTQFLTAMMMEPEKTHQLLRIITDFLIGWHHLQKKSIDSIDGIFLLDDLIGFMSRDQFEEFGLPCFKELFSGSHSIKFLHNDAPCSESAPLLEEMGVNLFNMGTDVTLPELRQLCGPGVTLMGNLPPRDVLAAASPDDILQATLDMLNGVATGDRFLPSCGGGMPPETPESNIQAFIKAVLETEKAV